MFYEDFPKTMIYVLYKLYMPNTKPTHSSFAFKKKKPKKQKEKDFGYCHLCVGLT